MANRIVIESERGTVDSLIKKFLMLNQDATAGKIWKHLQKNETAYDTKRGFYMRLKRLIELRIIVKFWRKDSLYPLYRLSKAERKVPSLIGFLLNARMKEELSNIRALKGDKEFWKFMTNLIGVYTIYIEVASWRMFSDRKTLNEKLEARKEFLDAALPLTLPVPERIDESDPIVDMSKAQKYYQSLPKELIKFEKELENAMPFHMQFCKAVFHEVRRVVKRME